MTEVHFSDDFAVMQTANGSITFLPFKTLDLRAQNSIIFRNQRRTCRDYSFGVVFEDKSAIDSVTFDQGWNWNAMGIGCRVSIKSQFASAISDFNSDGVQWLYVNGNQKEYLKIKRYKYCACDNDYSGLCDSFDAKYIREVTDIATETSTPKLVS